ncbi:ribonuclease H [candidate division WOR-3 bacterium]|uniref:Ribonuclease H n=1 Tax=candidate division WOR-3 bacterium TaxID=2052148 RepID=A0A660SJM9_UNCW3|nr:MAG: ribonuclease H [candidate division WOR-3 bacterium]
MTGKAEIYIDGSSRGNPGPGGIGIYIKAGDDEFRISEPIGSVTNNEAEYQALIRALEEAKRLNLDEILIKTDSSLLANQILGNYRIKSRKIVPLYRRVIKLLSNFRYKILLIPREENRIANNLALNASLTSG